MENDKDFKIKSIVDYKKIKLDMPVIKINEKLIESMIKSKNDYSNILLNLNENLRVSSDVFSGINDIGKDIRVVSDDFKKKIRENLDAGIDQKLINTADHNALNGWTITEDMDVNFYFDQKLLQSDKNNLDQYFIEYYEKKSMENLEKLEKSLLSKVDEKWKFIVAEVIKSYKIESGVLFIPLIISIIEGEIYNILECSLIEERLIGKRLISKFKSKIDESEATYFIFVEYGLYRYLYEELFRDVFFEQEQLTLSRNAIMHGRDNPRNWKSVDVLRLLNVLCTLVEVKYLYDKLK